jgi:hypothetical protein
MQRSATVISRPASVLRSSSAASVDFFRRTRRQRDTHEPGAA